MVAWLAWTKRVVPEFVERPAGEARYQKTVPRRNRRSGAQLRTFGYSLPLPSLSLRHCPVACIFPFGPQAANSFAGCLQGLLPTEEGVREVRWLHTFYVRTHLMRE